MPVDIKEYDIPRDDVVDHVYQDGELTQGGPHGVFKHSAVVNIPLSLAAPGLFLLKRAGVDSSTVDVTASTSQDPKTATFKIVVSFNDEKVKSKLGIIRLIDKRKQLGVGIFSPKGSKLPGISIETTITVPDGATVTALSTDVPDTTQKVHGVKKVHFLSLGLNGSGGPIDVEFADTVSGAYQTSNGGIFGKFSSSGGLSLNTSKGPIEAKVELTSSGKGISFDAGNSDAAVNASVSLISTTTTGGTFNVSGKTTNGKLDFNFPTAPVDSKLNFSANNSKGQTHARMHPTFEGSVFIQSNGQKPELKDLKPTDPTGQGRSRTMKTTPTDNSISGKVYWGNDKGKGNISMQTDHEKLVLEL